MPVEVRCFGERAASESTNRIALRGYTPWDRVGPGPDKALYAPALETLSIALAMARDPVDAQVAHAHTWYADMAGLWIRTLHRIPLCVTLHSMEPLRPWKADQLGSGYLLSSWIEKTAVESADLNAIVRDREFATHFATFGYEMVGGSVEEFAKFLAEDIERYRQLTRAAGIAPE